MLNGRNREIIGFRCVETHGIFGGIAAIVSVVADELTGIGSVEYPAGSTGLQFATHICFPRRSRYVRRFFVGECC